MDDVPRRAMKTGALRSALAYPLPYLGLLALLPMGRQLPVEAWFAQSAIVRTLALFAILTTAIGLFLVLSDWCYRLLDPDGLGRRTHSRSDLCEVLTTLGMIGMGVAWLLHARELPWSSVLALPALSLLWVIVLGTARRAALEGRRRGEGRD